VGTVRTSRRKSRHAPSAIGHVRSCISTGASLVALAVATAVHGQQSPSPAAQQAESEGPQVKKADDGADSAAEIEQVIVTGSRIRRDEFSSASTISIVDPKVAELQGQFTAAGLLQSGLLAAGSSQVNAAISSPQVMNGGAGGETIDLRGLGANRRLVLLNGRRMGPAGNEGAVNSVDLNTLPFSIIQKVDILKDGASSIYGSDAVAGVVNVITKRDTNELEFAFAGTQPSKGAGQD
jgi:iron complex outermembrane recepter protein